MKIYGRADRFGGFSLAARLLLFVMVDSDGGAREFLFLFILFSDIQMQVLIEVREFGAL